MKALGIVGIIGASCVGKSTQVQLILKHFTDLFRFSVSDTTRPIRPEKEIDGVHYHFRTLEEFKALEAAGAFIETNQFANGHWYGTRKAEVERATAEGKILLVDMEYQGAKRIYEEYPEECLLIFLDVSDEEARSRMERSTTGARESIKERLANIAEQRELARASNIFCHIIDTTRMGIDFVFNVIVNRIDAEIKTRQSATITGPTVA